MTERNEGHFETVLDIYEQAMAESEPKPDAFSITDDGTANWAVKKIAETRAETERIKAIAVDEIATLQHRIAKLEAETARRTGFLEACLRDYMRTVPKSMVHKTPTQEKYRLLDGDLIWKDQNPDINRDDTVLLPWLKKHRPDMVEVTEKLTWGEFKKTLEVKGTAMVTDEGEIVPGIKVSPIPPKFTVKTQ